MDPQRIKFWTSVLTKNDFVILRRGFPDFIFKEIDHESDWMHQVAPRTLKAPKMEQKVTPGIHISRIRDGLFVRFSANIGKNC